MKCLSDVMDYFMRTSGGSTHPLIVNDMKVLGQDTPGYATQITSMYSSASSFISNYIRLYHINVKCFVGLYLATLRVSYT